MKKFYFSFVLSLFALQAFSQIPEYCLENDTVNHYLTQVQYDSTNYKYSEITKYCLNYPWDWEGEGKGMRLDQPLPVPIKLKKALSAAGTLYISEFSDYSDAATKVISVAKGVDSIAVWNLIPGRTYNWKIVGTSGVVESGQFKTTGTLRMLKIDNVFNVRDLGGWKGLRGYPIRYGVLIRGSRLNVNSSSTLMITESGIEELRWAGMRAELDMRDASNSLNAQYAYFSKNNDSPLYSVNSAYNSRIATFANAPQSIIGVKKLIEWLKQGKHVYLHCSVGADRTGTVAYLVGALCGMSEDALCKDFELTSFSGDKIDNEAARGTYERLIRQRSYVGRLDDCSSPDSYKFADMVDKIKKFPGETLQQKVYYHLNTGAKGDGTFLTESVPAADLDWLINYMLNPIELNANGTVTLERGSTKQIEVHLSKGNPADVTYTSSNPAIATVSESGLITAKASGTTTVKVSYDGFEKTFAVTVPLVESVLPDTVFTEGYYYFQKDKNIIKNGSFEYLNAFENWKGANESPLSEEAFYLRSYENSDDKYIESKGDGDSTSYKSLRNMWSIKKKKTYVFGYRVKNSTDIKTENNTNLAVSLITTSVTADGSGDDFIWDTANPAPQRVGGRDVIASKTFDYYPTYDSEWTDVQYVFTNTDGFKYIQVWFTHLSKDGNNTCFDNFYLYELSDPTVVIDIPAQPAQPVRKVEDNRIFNLAGQEVTNPGPGIYIMNGKKYIIK